MKYLYLLLFGMLPAAVFSQTNFQQGYIIKTAGDTLRGYIDNREWNRNPDVVNFKQNNSDKGITHYKPIELRAFALNGGNEYQSYHVNISLGKVKGTQLSSGVDTTTQNIVAYLKVLTDGPRVKLYEYTDQIKSRYFVQESDQPEPVELKLDVFFNTATEGNNIVTREAYKGQLNLLTKKYAADNAGLLKKIDATEYNAVPLIKVINIINNKAENKVVEENSHFRFFIGAGAGITQSKFSGNNEFATAKSSKTTTPVFSAGLDFLPKPHSQRFILRAEFLYWYTNPSLEADHVSSVDKYTASIKQHTFTILPQVIYNLYNTQSVKVYVGTGVGINLSTYKTIKTITVNAYTVAYDNDFKFDPNWINIPVEAGVILNKRFELSARYSLPAEYSSGEYSIKVNQLQFGAHLFFGKTQ